MKKIYLVDVSSMFFRAFYAVRSLTSPSGMPTNAIYGFLSMLVKLLKDEKPEYMVFCYDRKEPSFRKDLYAEYKANRTEMPEDLVPQIPYIRKLAEIMGVPALEIAPYEADDIIGALTKLARKNQFEVTIVSGDKDFAQLIDDHVVLYDTMKDIRYDKVTAFEKWGIHPEQMIDYLALVGDSSDNVPGVAGIGPKGAIKLLEAYKSLEAIYENLESVNPKGIQQKLKDSRDMAFLSKKLVTIALDVPLAEDMLTYKLKPIHQEELRAFLRELNFKTMEKNLLGEASSEPTNPSSVEALATTEHAHTENSSQEINVQDMPIDQLALHLKANSEVWAIHDERGVYLGQVLSENTAQVFRLQGELVELGKLTDKLRWAWKGFDLKNFWHQIKCQKPILNWDSQLAAYVLKAGDVGTFAEVYKDIFALELPPLAGPEVLLEAHLRLANTLKVQLHKVHNEAVLEKMDAPLAPVLYRMEVAGVQIDGELLQQQSRELAASLKDLETKIYEISGEPFNIQSPKQLGFVLFEKLKLPVQKKTKTGYSTDNDVLEKLKDHSPIADLIIEFREMSKLKSTYLDAIPQLLDAHGRVHSHFNQALTATGRLSSTNPNLQNIPIRTERGARVRRAFIAAPGNVLLSVDYNQIELRILAHYANDPNLIEAFKNNVDIHAATASQVFGVSLDKVTSDLRRTAKAVNFGIAYGQGAFGLAENLGISRGEASKIIDTYFARFPKVNEYIETMTKSAYEKGYVETILGRRRYIEELKSKNSAIKKFGERAAINAPIQGTAADIVKLAMVKVDQLIQDRTDIKMILQVHDELIFEGAPTAIEELKPQITSLMEGVTALHVPLRVSCGVGNNWEEAH